MILVAGGGGFIGGHLVAKLLKDGRQVRAVDIKPIEEWFQPSTSLVELQKMPFRESHSGFDLRREDACKSAVKGITDVYNLAADMGGMGFIEKNKALCMRSVLINTNLIECALRAGVKRYFYASSACVYNAAAQYRNRRTGLKEEEAYPAMPEDGYGWEKLFSERMCRHYTEDFGLRTHVARFHNVYGPNGTWTGGREKAPAAICRKVIEAKLSGRHEINIWGDGNQTRSFMYIDDCIEGIQRIVAGDVREPINLGSSESVSINQLVTIVEGIAGIKLQRSYDRAAPKGVDGRNSDNTLIRERTGWEPGIALRVGLEKTYRWIYDQMVK